MSDAALLSDLILFQELARTAEISSEKEKQPTERQRTDVTGRWMGYDDEGLFF